MHEPVGQRGAHSGKSCRLDEIAFGDKDTDRTHHKAGQDRAAAEHFEAMLEHALLPQ